MAEDQLQVVERMLVAESKPVAALTEEEIQLAGLRVAVIQLAEARLWTDLLVLLLASPS